MLRGCNFAPGNLIQRIKGKWIDGGVLDLLIAEDEEIHREIVTL